MKSIDKLQNKLSGLYYAISRYPLTVIFLIAAASVNATAINREESYYKLLLTFVVGACLSFTMQTVFERFFCKFLHRVTLMFISALLTGGYFLIVNQYTNTTDLETWIRTSVALLALVIAYIWIPVIKSKFNFNESFMSVFKSFFNSLLFSLVLFIGISLIITAIDLLLFKVNEKSYMHALNIISLLFAPIYFLSLNPLYPGVFRENLLKTNTRDNKEFIENHDEKIVRAFSCPKFLEILISYIIIPLLSVYTAILIIYITRSINTKFWSDNRLEPMLVGFSIAVIFIYILASSIQNKFTILFRRVFPKVLVPIVIFQIVSSVLRTQDTGITHGRYFVIVFGIFAAITGILLSFITVKINSIVAILLIIFSLFSIIPPLDAFTVSRKNQEKLLKKILIENNMLLDNKITPNPSVSEKDKKIITTTLNYLEMIGYTKDLTYLGNDFNLYKDFYNTFGFYLYEENNYRQEGIYTSLNRQLPLIISGYDALVVTDFYFEKPNKHPDNKLCNFEKSEKTYTISITYSTDSSKLWVTNENGEEFILVNMNDVFNKFDTLLSGNHQINKGSMTPDQATFTVENDKAIISLVALNINIEKSNYNHPYNGEFYVLVKIK